MAPPGVFANGGDAVKGEAIIYDAAADQVFTMPWGFWVGLITAYPRFELIGEL